MLKLKNMGNCDIQSDTHYSIVTICNWEKYQSNIIDLGQARGHPSDRQVTGKGQASDTNKNVKNDKNEKKNIYGEFKNVKLTDNEKKKLLEKFGSKTTTEMIENLSGYIASKGKKYKSHYATILNWHRMRNGNENEQQIGFYTCPECKRQVSGLISGVCRDCHE